MYCQRIISPCLTAHKNTLSSIFRSNRDRGKWPKLAARTGTAPGLWFEIAQPDKGEKMDDEVKLLQNRLNSVLENPHVSTDALKDEIRFCAQRAINALKTQNKLIRISDSMQEMIREQRNELERLNHQKSALFSIISHDLGGPYATILNGLELLQDHYPFLNETDRLDMVKKIHGAGKNLKELLDNLLQWANIQMHGMRLCRLPQDLPDLLISAVGQVTPIAEAKQIRITMHADAIQILGDAMMLDTVLRNLLTNAIKFSHRGGEVQISSRETPTGVLFEVRDHGVGLDDATRATLFNITTKSSRPGTEKERGTGLGLVICQEMLALHNSHLVVESAPDRGSTFRFILPPWSGESPVSPR